MDELAISELEKLKYIYFLACIFYISGNESGGCKAMYRTLLARCEYRVCSHSVYIILCVISMILTPCRGEKCTAPCSQGVSTGFVLIGYILYVCHFHDTHTLQARCGTFLSSEICNEKST